MSKKKLKYLFTRNKVLCYDKFDSRGKGSRIIMKKGYDVLDIATWFIYKTNAEKKEIQANNDNIEVYEGLTHLKLEKLLYFAQGISLSKNNKVLFCDEIEAWEHGPVVRKVFKTFSNKGRDEITLADAPKSAEVINKIENDSETREILIMTYDNFAIYTAWQLRNITHEKGSPWYQTFEPNKNKKIDVKLIKEYFDKEIME